MSMVSALLLLFVFLFNDSIKSIRCELTLKSTEDSNDPTGWGSADDPNHNTFVDPTGWNYDRETKRLPRSGDNKDIVAFCSSLLKTDSSKKFFPDSFQEELNNVTHDLSTKYDRNIAFVRRFVNILLDSADLPKKFKNNEKNALGVIEVRLTSEQYEILTLFSESRKHISFQQLDSVLSKSIFGRNEPPFDIESAIEHTLFIMSQYWVPFVLFVIALFIMRLIRDNELNKKSYLQLIVSLLLVIFVIAFLNEYYRMYKEAEVKQKIILEKHREIPRSCFAENTSWLTALWGSLVSAVSFENEDCLEYHKAVLLDPLVEVSPLKVLSHILAEFILAPVSQIGEAIAAFATAIIGRLPFPYGFLVFIISFVGGLFFLFLFLMALCGHTIHLGNMFVGFTISSKKKPEITSRDVPKLTMDATCNNCSSSTSGKTEYVLVEANHLKKLMEAGPSDRIEELESLSFQTKNSKSTIEEAAALKRLSSEESKEMNKDLSEKTTPTIPLDSLNKQLLCEIFKKCEKLESVISNQGVTSSTIETNQEIDPNVNVTHIVEKKPVNED